MLASAIGDLLAAILGGVLVVLLLIDAGPVGWAVAAVALVVLAATRRHGRHIPRG